MMDPAYSGVYRELYTQHWWWRSREAMLLDVLRRRLSPSRQRAILDVGCGGGFLFDQLAQFGEVEGVEADESLIGDKHRERIHLARYDDDFDPGKAFSLILMLDVLEHLPDPVSAVRHSLELLEPDGLIVVTVPAFRLLWTGHDEINRHYTRYTKRTFREMARKADLRIDCDRYFFHWVFPAKLARRLVETTFQLSPSVPRVPPGWINESLYLLSRTEHRVLGRLPIPFGSSLLVVGGRRGD
ncbi:MAG: class I SAM-dependent methyltransferase [Gemmatimonadota bacterium]|nr:MAG: class I SAM-dependent methyltransferase [Gemmatimonadota bacterium]